MIIFRVGNYHLLFVYMLLIRAAQHFQVFECTRIITPDGIICTLFLEPHQPLYCTVIAYMLYSRQALLRAPGLTCVCSIDADLFPLVPF